MTETAVNSSSDDELPWPSPAGAWWAIAVFFVAAILYYTDRFILNLLVDPIRADLHITDTQISLLQGLAFALVYSFAGLPFGRLADILPRRSVIIAGVLTWSAATVACGFAHSFGALFAARVGVGIGEAALAPAAVSMIADYFAPARRGSALGVFLMGMALGGGMATVVGGGLLQAANGGVFHDIPIVAQLTPWRTVLVLLGLPGIVIVALMLTVREPVRRDRTGLVHERLPLKTVFSEFARRAHYLAPLYLALGIASAGDTAIGNWTPALLSRRFAFSPGEIASTLGTVAIATGIVGSLAGGFFSDVMAKRGGPRARVLTALVTFVVAVAGSAVAFAGNGYEVIILCTIWSLMMSLGQALGITLLQELVPNEMRGIGTSLVSFCNILIGLGVGSTLTALFTDYVYRSPLLVGWSITSVAAPAGMIAVLLLWLSFRGLKNVPSAA